MFCCDLFCSFDEFWVVWERDEFMIIFDKCWLNLLFRSFFMDVENDIFDCLWMFFDVKRLCFLIWKLCYFFVLGDLFIEVVVFEIV